MDKLELIVAKIDELKKDNKEQLDQIEMDVDSIRDHIVQINYDLRRNTDDLEIHMKRTELNEKRLEKIEDKLTVEYLLKLIMAAIIGSGTIAGSVYAVIKLIDYIAQ